MLATKFTFNGQPGNPNAAGNGRKNIYRALEASLSRLKTDYIDLYWLHAWDGLTPVEELMRTLDDLVRSGKVRHIGLSDVPAWYLARAQTLAQWRALQPIAALQLEYSLVERNIEHEFVPAALELGVGICPWSPLGGGLLAGKYRRSGDSGEGVGRLETTKNSPNPVFRKFSARNWEIVEALTQVAQKLDRPPVQVALNSITKRPAVVSTIIGATSTPQLEQNLAALDFRIPAELSEQLDQASAPACPFPYTFFAKGMRGMATGGVAVAAEPPWYRGR